MRRRTLLSSSGGIDPTAGRKKIGNYEVVDLGLPSGLLWATCNVGATKETSNGNYYQWGAGSTTYQNENQYHTGGTDSSYTLPSSYDTARQVMGYGWRMPTLTEMQELTTKTTYSFDTINGVEGAIFISKTNPKAYVFFPTAGYYDEDEHYQEGIRGFYWSSTPRYSDTAFVLDFFSAYMGVSGLQSRSGGFSVRGVHA